MNPFQLTYKRYGSSSILIEWPSKIDEDILRDVLSFKRAIQDQFSKETSIINHAYHSILISYKFPITNFDVAIAELIELYNQKSGIENFKYHTWEIPVCYDSKFALDIDLISREKNLSAEEVIQLHSSAMYRIYFLGFLPGFLYLGGLDERLFMPRKATPRQQISKGAVAIGGEQTGIYPNESPGGWNIIGNSPLLFFNATKEQPCFAQAGDTLKFISITREEHQSITQSIVEGTYELKKIESHD